eukprot:15461152-Alexandrium_andersonii.AAC.1
MPLVRSMRPALPPPRGPCFLGDDSLALAVLSAGRSGAEGSEGRRVEGKEGGRVGGQLLEGWRVGG